MSSLLYRTEPSYQNRMNAIVWFEIPAWELWKSMSRGRLIIMCCSGCFCLSVFMVPTLSNQKITSPILLDLFLMAFFSSLLFSYFWRNKRRNWSCSDHITGHHHQHKDGDRQGVLLGFCWDLMRCERSANTALYPPVVQSHLITQSQTGSRLLRLSSQLVCNQNHCRQKAQCEMQELEIFAIDIWYHGAGRGPAVLHPLTQIIVMY